MNSQVILNSDSQNKINYKYIGNVANALYILSQNALSQKMKAIQMTKELDAGDISDNEIDGHQQRIKSILKEQQFFHAERQVIIRHLINSKQAKLLGYVEVKNINYGLVKIDSHKFYCIITKKLIQKFKLKKLGDKFQAFDVKSDDELKTIMTLGDAKRVFNLFHNLVLQKNKQKLIGQQAKNKKSVAPTVLGNTVTEKGSVIVVKKKPKKD